MKQKINDAHRIIDEAIEKYEPSYIYTALSGGNDSMAATTLASDFLGERLDGVVHINTGIGIKETGEFVREQCSLNNWKLHEYKAEENTNSKGEPDPVLYRDMVLEWGFPGPNMHRVMYRMLKRQALYRMCRDHDGQVMLISGIHKSESSRRMRLTNKYSLYDRVVWCAPCFEWSGNDFYDYREGREIPQNPVSKLLGMSGECLCGAFAHKGELALIRLVSPRTADRIEALQKEVIAAGFPWGWEESPPSWWIARNRAENAGQIDAFDEERDDTLKELVFMPLCVGCEK